MSIYKFRISEESYVDVAVEADSIDEARKGLDGWLGDDKDHDEFRDIMNSRCSDKTTYIAVDEKSSPIDLEWDFNIKAEDYIPKTNLYTLVLARKSTCNGLLITKQTYTDMMFEEVLKKLQEMNKTCIIRPGVPDQVSNATAMSYNNILLYYTYEWR